ncbi:hypothetical protein D9611_007062 [Ephemerocybe angulata]|uniref:Uncharacterized protein n=1 Tax=Ephemerocybe angulata TaxID=980116 RepID=A0A8H5B114_9AGAR|nr:hypothetical protein D9611_007062 [Tulosesus angulatus]
MKFCTTALGFSSLSIRALAGRTCQTSGGSPTADDANWVEAYWHTANLNGNVYQNNPTGCSTLNTFGTASINFCGPQGSSQPVSVVSAHLVEILLNCESNGRIGGRNQWDSYHADVFHS